MEHNYCSGFGELIGVEEEAEAYSNLARFEELVVVGAEHSIAATAAEVVESSAVNHMRARWRPVVQHVDHWWLAVLAGQKMKNSLQ